jgi:[ribosomal protein S18]-alanine N-acetyltransferase
MATEFLNIDRMRDSDLISAVNLELQCGLNSWGIERYRIGLSDPNSVLLVARIDTDHVVGVFSAALVLDELQIDNLAVAPYWRRQKIATKLVLQGFNLAAQRNAVNAFLEVRAANRTAIEFYKKHGFSISGTRIAYYRNPPDDALMMRCNILEKLKRTSIKKFK